MICFKYIILNTPHKDDDKRIIIIIIIIIIITNTGKRRICKTA